MTAVTQPSAVYQLIGRVIYFHVLFIEPALSQPGAAGQAGPCCRHASSVSFSTTTRAAAPASSDGYLGGWAGLEEIARGLPGCYRPCPWPAPCCPACVIGPAGAAIATTWASTECAEYGLNAPSTKFLAACAGTAARQMAAAFARCSGVTCGFAETAAATPGQACELPLTTELLQLWRDPERVGTAPVTSWLNHCSSLADIRSERHSRRTHGDPHR